MAIQQAALLLEKFYPSHVLRNLPILEEDFWENKGLVSHDWPGLAGLMYSDIFSLDFLTPLDEADTKFKLEVCIPQVPFHFCSFILIHFVSFFLLLVSPAPFSSGPFKIY